MGRPLAGARQCAGRREKKSVVSVLVRETDRGAQDRRREIQDERSKRKGRSVERESERE